MTLTKNEIYHGDCVKLLRRVPAGSVDLVFADPPFNIGYQYDVYQDRRGADDYLNWCCQWIRGISQSLKPDGTFWLAIGDEYAAELKIAAQECGFVCRSWVIWYYTFGVNCARGFSRSHTHLFHFVKDARQFTFNADNPKNRVPSARQLVYADKRANPKGRLPDNTWIYRPDNQWVYRPQDASLLNPFSFQPDHDTWYFARVAGTFKEREGFHGCQMPEQLLGRIIRVSSNPGELVLDPFSGSGTTLAVAKKLGRQWMGFELSREYAEFIGLRLRQTQVNDPLDGAEDPLRSAPTTRRGKRRQQGPIDERTRAGIIDAFGKTSEGYSADYLLCHPEINDAFVRQCRKQKIPGDAYTWNKLLLRLRKSKRLPRSTRKTIRLTFPQMDAYSFASEIAARLMSIDYGLTLDDILCSPRFAAEFDRIAIQYGPQVSAFEYRWAALALRKRAKASRRIASEKYSQWLSKRLPSPIPLAAGTDSEYHRPGVYVLSSESQPLYVGESENLGLRIEHAINNPQWAELEPSTVIMFPLASAQRHGLQSALVERIQPVLNCSQLRMGRERQVAQC